MPLTLHEKFHDAAIALAKMSLSRGYSKATRVYIRANLKGGTIPNELRSSVNHRKQNFSSIYLVLQAPNWILNKAVEVSGKTMITGWIENTNQMFLIGAYDPTPVTDFLENWLDRLTEE